MLKITNNSPESLLAHQPPWRPKRRTSRPPRALFFCHLTVLLLACRGSVDVSPPVSTATMGGGSSESDSGASCGSEDLPCCEGATCDDDDGDQKLVCFQEFCRSREWALWPIPSPPGAGAPHAVDYAVHSTTVLDNITGLEWERKVTKDTFDWEGARAYCRSLQIDGRFFRLPTRIELTSLIQFDRVGPAVDDDVFPDVASGNQHYYWTSSGTPDNAKAFAVDVYFGFSGPHKKAYSYGAFCVARSLP